jgi:hypothetical protein
MRDVAVFVEGKRRTKNRARWWKFMIAIERRM